MTVDHREAMPENDAPDIARPEIQPRWSCESEQQTLGGVLLEPGTLPLVAAIAPPSDYYHPAHAVIMRAFVEMDHLGIPIDPVTLAQHLKASKPPRLNTIGGHAFIADLTSSVVTTAHIEHHARVIADAAVLRRMREAAVLTIGKVDDPSVPRDAALEFGQRRFLLATEQRNVSKPKSLGAVVWAALDAIALARTNNRRVTGRQTRYRELDLLLGGWHPGKFYVIAARPAMGKSALALALAEDIAAGVSLGPAIATVGPGATVHQPGAPVLFVSLEMKSNELGNRVLCARANVDGNKLRTNMLTAADDTALMDAAEAVRQFPLFIVDDDTSTLAGLKSLGRKFKAEHGEIGMMVVDYLQLMEGDGDEESRERTISQVSRGLKKLAGELACPVVALSQLNRGPETRTGKDKRPRLGDLRESGAIEQDADVVLLIYRDEVYNKDTDDKGIAEIDVAKQRGGGTGVVKLRWVKACTRFDCMFEVDHGASPEPVTAPLAHGPYPGDGDPGPQEPDRREPREAPLWNGNDF